MKVNRILLLILLVIIVVFVGVAGWLYSANSSEVDKQNSLKQQITLNQKKLSEGEAANKSAGTEATTLENELNAAQNALSQIKFLSSAESIENDGILFSMAADNNLQITSLTATPPADMTENNNNYQLTTFTVNIEGLVPQNVFTNVADSVSYINDTENNILAFTHEVANSPDFYTAEMPTVSLNLPVPMTDADITALNNTIDDEVQAGLTPDKTQDLTADEITALVKTTLKAMTPTQVQTLIAQAGITVPTAVITIQIWTLKGA
jgi:hypothetical protein